MMDGCPREPEVVDILMRRSSPGPELDGHLEQCEACRDVAALASVLRDDRDWLRHDVPLPGSAQVWWRAAARARLEGTQAAARPLTWAHGVAAAAAAGLLAATGGTAWTAIERVFSWVGTRATSLVPAAPQLPDLMTLGVTRGVMYALILGCAVLMPLVLYLALVDE